MAVTVPRVMCICNCLENPYPDLESPCRARALPLRMQLSVAALRHSPAARCTPITRLEAAAEGRHVTKAIGDGDVGDRMRRERGVGQRRRTAREALVTQPAHDTGAVAGERALQRACRHPLRARD